MGASGDHGGERQCGRATGGNGSGDGQSHTEPRVEQAQAQRGERRARPGNVPGLKYQNRRADQDAAERAAMQPEGDP
jgi:hypothetical protein